MLPRLGQSRQQGTQFTSHGRGYQCLPTCHVTHVYQSQPDAQISYYELSVLKASSAAPPLQRQCARCRLRRLMCCRHADSDFHVRRIVSKGK